MDIAKHIEKLVNTQKNSTEEILLEILNELKEIKILLNKKNSKSNIKNKQYYDFINTIRNKLKKDASFEINFKNQTIKIDKFGFLYNKLTSRRLTAQEAFEVFQYIYKNRHNLNI